jgi:hypothetical protein
MMRFWEARCPVDARMKAWIEIRLGFLANHFGLDRIARTRMHEPTKQFFAHSTSRGISPRSLLEQISHSMQLDPRQISLTFDPDRDLPSSASRVELRGGDVQLRVAESRWQDLPSLVASIARELARFRLQRDGLLDGTTSDEEHLVDLSTVIFGYGIFSANAVIQETNEQAGSWYHWWMGRNGHLTARDFGYALALFAWIRHEERPTWLSYLRLDARSSLRKGIRYLQRTEDSLLTRSGKSTYGNRSTSMLLSELHDGTDGARIAALWEMRQQPDSMGNLIPAATALLRHTNPLVRAEAAWTLGTFGEAAKPVTKDLLMRLQDDVAEVRGNALWALRQIKTDPVVVVSRVAAMLRDRHPLVVRQAVLCLQEYGQEAEAFVALLLRVLATALVQCDLDLSEEALLAITNATESYGAAISQYFAQDEELLRQVLEILRQQDESLATPGTREADALD